MRSKHVLRSVARHRVLVAAVILVTLGAAGIGWSLMPKSYDSTATVSAAGRTTTTDATPEDLDALRWSLGELADSQVVLADVAARLSVPRSTDDLRRSIDGSWVEGTVLVRVRASDRDPDVAAEIANTTARVLPRYDLSNGALVFTTSNPARPATSPAGHRPLLGLGAAAVLALLLAVAAALLRERRTAGPRDARELEELTGAPVLVAMTQPRDPTTLPALYPGTAAADHFRQLRISLEAEASDDPVSLVVVAGVGDPDIGVWLGANLAVSLAHVNRRVLLVDGRVGEREAGPGIAPDTLGLYDVLTGADLADALSAGPVETLTVLPSGEWVGAGADTLLETRFGAVMSQATERFDVVVVLAPSLDVCEDARIMAAGGSLVLAVPESGVSPDDLRRHIARIRSVGIRLLGVVLISNEPEREPARI